MKRVYRFIFLTLFICFASASAFSAITLKIQTITKNVRADYTGDLQIEITETIRIRHKGDATDYFLTFSEGQSNDADNRALIDPGTSETLPYQLYDGATGMNILKDNLPIADISNVISGTFGANQPVARQPVAER